MFPSPTTVIKLYLSCTRQEYQKGGSRQKKPQVHAPQNLACRLQMRPYSIFCGEDVDFIQANA
jgi:hypothetical protein